MKLFSKDTLRETVLPVLNRFRIPLLFLALGLALLLLPNGKQSKAEVPAQQQSEDQQLLKTRQELQKLLQSIEGAGKVELLLSVECSSQQVYQTDLRTGSSGSETTTVFSGSGSAQKSPVVSCTRAPIYLGAVVVCQGAEKASVRLAVVQAVSSLTGLRSDKIAVIKMKN